MPLPSYEKKEYKKTRTTKGYWYLSSYNYKFNLSNIKIFLKGLKQGKLLGLKCRSCNTVSFPPRLICGRCLKKPDQWVTLPKTAKVSTFSATYEENEEGEKIPYPVVAVQQDGADTVFVQNLNEEQVDFHDVYVGMPLKVAWAPERKGQWMDIDHYDAIPDPAQKLNQEKSTDD